MEKFSIEDLSMKEVTIIEQKSGLAIDKLADEDAPKGPLFTAIYWVAMKRENPKFTWSNAEDTSFKTIMTFIGAMGETSDPNSEK
ncbi:hypothetical protein OHB41_33110 [Streptomyces sp. NBC_01571]|uniref:hypothetical protein n=1 Tax=Streptomyces sp. NBC_01571 TaxID=2975883 RepID=UPI002257CC3F|nr:hypothetical protein [Streptomyces sp. NBC_01571]MCX4577941.1 hypothetical protein [Streptomyces sp. NBC_01571]